MLIRIVSTVLLFAARAVVPACGQTGPAPTGVQAVAVNSSSVMVTWNSLKGATGFAVGRNCTGVPPSGGCQATSGVLAPTATSWSDGGLMAATSYAYQVAVRYADGRVGVAQVAVTTPGITVTAPAPRALTEPVTVTSSAIAVSGGATAPELSWASVKGAIGYSVAGARQDFRNELAVSVGRGTKWRWPVAEVPFYPGTYSIVVSAQLSNGLVVEVGRTWLSVEPARTIPVGVRTALDGCTVAWNPVANSLRLLVVRHPTALWPMASVAEWDARSYLPMPTETTTQCDCPNYLLTRTCHGTFTVLVLLGDRTWLKGVGSN